MAPGDFVRNCKQLLDLLRQIEDVAGRRDGGRRPRRRASRAPRRRRLHGRLATMRADDASPFGELAVIANPNAGEGRVGRELAGAASAALASAGLEYRLHVVTDGPGDATRLAADGARRRLPVPGGRGRRRHGAGRRERDVPRRPADRRTEPVLGRRGRALRAAISCGASGCPATSTRACGHLLGENTYPFDVMKVAATGPDGERTIRYAHNLAEVGLRRGGRGRASACRRGPAARGGSWGSGRRFARTRVRGRRGRGRPQRPRGPGVERRRRQRAVHRRRAAAVAAVVPGRRGPRRARVHGAAVGRVHDAAADVPPRRPRPATRTSTSCARRSRVVDRRRPPDAGRGRRRAPGDDPGDVPDRPPADPAEAVSADRLTRTRRGWPPRRAARAAGGRRRGPSPDLAYLTGYDPMPLERPTLLVLRPDARPVLVVPELERPLALDSSPRRRSIEMPAGPTATIRTRDAAAAPGAGARRRSGTGCGPSHLLALQAAAPGIAFDPASPVHRAAACGEGRGRARRAPTGGAAPPTRRSGDLRHARSPGRSERRSPPTSRGCWSSTATRRADFTIVAIGPNGASPHHEPGERTIRARRRVVLDFGGELDGYCSDTTRTVVVGEPTGAGRRGPRRRCRRPRRPACEAVRPGVAAPGGRPRRARA